MLSTTEEGHQKFMEMYKDVFVKKPKKIGFPVHTEKRVLVLLMGQKKGFAYI